MSRRSTVVARGWLTMGGEDRMQIELTDRGRVRYSGEGPTDWINIIIDEYGDHMVKADRGAVSLLPVREDTFRHFLQTITALVYANTGVRWGWRVEGEIIDTRSSGRRADGSMPIPY